MIDTSTAKSAVTLEDAKLHLRVDHSADDADRAQTEQRNLREFFTDSKPQHRA